MDLQKPTKRDFVAAGNSRLIKILSLTLALLVVTGAFLPDLIWLGARKVTVSDVKPYSGLWLIGTLSDPALSDEFARTGARLDLVEIKNGCVHLRGRLSDQINVAGRKISPESIERALLAHEHVRDCLVFGVPSQDSGRAEEIVACVATQASVPVENLKQFLLTRLPAWQIPRDWWFVDSLETNQRGKLSRSEWRKKYLAR